MSPRWTRSVSTVLSGRNSSGDKWKSKRLTCSWRASKRRMLRKPICPTSRRLYRFLSGSNFLASLSLASLFSSSYSILRSIIPTTGKRMSHHQRGSRKASASRKKCFGSLLSRLLREPESGMWFARPQSPNRCSLGKPLRSHPSDGDLSSTSPTSTETPQRMLRSENLPSTSRRTWRTEMKHTPCASRKDCGRVPSRHALT
mmetsp:Transcript_4568/g.10928  ORF Transcript_4568/g.10928 Transcript_4568/m.10928 type:complete len:201 (+) Transcript_4568:312-914(+)